MPTVRTFNKKELNKAIKKSDPLIQDYIRALKSVIDIQEETIKICKLRLREKDK